MVARLLLCLLMALSPSEGQEDPTETMPEDEDTLADVYDLDSWRQRRLDLT